MYECLGVDARMKTRKGMICCLSTVEYDPEKLFVSE